MERRYEDGWKESSAVPGAIIPVALNMGPLSDLIAGRSGGMESGS